MSDEPEVPAKPPEPATPRLGLRPAARKPAPEPAIPDHEAASETAASAKAEAPASTPDLSADSSADLSAEALAKVEASATVEASAKASPDPQTPDPKPQTQNPGPQIPSAGNRLPIDYALPSQKKSWLPTPAMIRNIGCLVKMIAAFTFLLCLGYFALVALNPKARQWALQGTKAGPGGAPPSGKGPTPFKALNQVLAIPAQAMGKTDDVVKANNARVGVLDGVIKEEEGKSSRAHRSVVDPFANASPVGGTSRPDKSASETTESGPQAVSGTALLALAEIRGVTIAPDPGTPDSKPQAPKSQIQDPGPQTPDQMKLAGDIVIAHASPAGTPRANAAFFYSVVKLNVSGITQGKPARALINNRLTYEGDEINRQFGIVFAELDATNNLLVFKDKTGATVTRSY